MSIKKPHVLAVPFPAQGHVTPLMKLSRIIADSGIKVTFVNTQYIHQKLVNAAVLSDSDEDQHNNIVLTTIPDGLSPEDDHSDTFKVLESLKSSLAGSLMDLIVKINLSESECSVSCVIADITVGWILEIITEEIMGIEPVVFTPTSAASLAIILQIPKYIEQGCIDGNGTVTKDQTISMSDEIPTCKENEFVWSFPVDLKTQKIFFECSLAVEKTANQAKWLLCNTFYELESSALDLFPKLLPVGPLLETNNNSNSSSFCPEDLSCLSWLDEKSTASVIYVSFGSLAVFSQHQLDELAFGLELSGRPFLWVVRSNLANGAQVEFSDGFLERVNVSMVGKIVEWAPQEKVLSHPSVAYFLSHCGWNSTVEGLSRGLSFLCWPYFADQFHNQSYICEKWKIGLRIDADENGIRSRHEIRGKIEMLVTDDSLRENALKFKEIASKSIGGIGSSSKNLAQLIDHLKK